MDSYREKVVVITILLEEATRRGGGGEVGFCRSARVRHHRPHVCPTALISGPAVVIHGLFLGVPALAMMVVVERLVSLTVVAPPVGGGLVTLMKGEIEELLRLHVCSLGLLTSD